MDLQRLRIFVSVAEAGGFSKAAKSLSLVQSAVSRQVHLLEQETGLTLFRRNGRGALLTDSGVFLLERARQILDMVGRLEQDLEQFTASPSGLVTVALPPTLSVLVIGPLIQVMGETYPNIRLQFTEGFSTQINGLLERGEVDLALVYGAAKRRAMVTEFLFDEELYLIGPGDMTQSGPVSMSELVTLPLVVTTPAHRTQLDAAFEAFGKPLNIRYEIDSTSTQREMVRAGVGYSIDSCAAIYQELRRGDLRLRRFKDVNFRRPIVLAFAADRNIGRASLAVAETIKSILQSLRERGYWMEQDAAAPADPVG